MGMLFLRSALVYLHVRHPFLKNLNFVDFVDYLDLQEIYSTEDSFVIRMHMNLDIVVKELKEEDDCFATPDGPLSERIPSAAISSVNNEVKDLVDTTANDSRKQGLHQNYTQWENARIGKRGSQIRSHIHIMAFW